MASDTEVKNLQEKFDNYHTDVIRKFDEQNVVVNKISAALLGGFGSENPVGLLEKVRITEKTINELIAWKENAEKELRAQKSFIDNYKRNLKVALIILSFVGSIISWGIKALWAYILTKTTGIPN